MKKYKITALLLASLMICSMAGCSDNNDGEKSRDRNENSASEAFSEPEEKTERVTKATEPKTEAATEPKTEAVTEPKRTKITDILKYHFYSGDHVFDEEGRSIVVGGNDRIYAIDNQGKLLVDLGAASEYQTRHIRLANNCIQISSSNDGWKILDLNGQEICEDLEPIKDTNIIVSKSGYYPVKTVVDELAGKTEYLGFNNINGASAVNFDVASRCERYICDDIYLICEGDINGYNFNKEYYLYDVSSNRKISVNGSSDWEECEIIEGWIKLNDSYWKRDLSDPNPHYGNLLVDKYAYVNYKDVYSKENNIELYNEENCIFDAAGNILKDFSDEGELRKVIYENGTFHIVSNTDFYYAMDENFQYIIQPIKLPNDEETHKVWSLGLVKDGEAYFYSGIDGNGCWIKADKNGEFSSLTDNPDDKFFSFNGDYGFIQNRGIFNSATGEIADGIYSD